jgi:hypothetical protein
VFGVVACYGVGAWMFLTAMDRSQSLTYCPPAIKHGPEILADEILLRGSDLQYSTRSELVRPAAKMGDADLHEELLRAHTTPTASIEEA